MTHFSPHTVTWGARKRVKRHSTNKGRKAALRGLHNRKASVAKHKQRRTWS